MNEERPDSGESHAFPTLQRIDIACDEFETQWKQGQRPDIATHVEAVAQSDRPALVVELVRLDVDYRRLAGEKPEVADYIARYPQWEASIQRAFNENSLTPTAHGFAATTPRIDLAKGCNDDTTSQLQSIGTGVGGFSDDALPAALPSIAGYQIKGRLGAGGMGAVWRAMQLNTGREVALKTIRDSFASTEARLRFQREVELAARLDHPNIAQVFDSGRDGDVDYYAMRLVRGQSLDKFVKSKHLNQKEILELMQVVCEAVQHAHQRGVIHRDLKPPNILVDEQGAPHVLDFGLAKAQIDQEEQTRDYATLTREGVVAGTLAFMAPEQAAGRTNEVDTRTDVYTLGVILYRLLTENSPHEMEGSSLDIIRRIVDEDVRLPRHFAPSMNRDLEAILLKALSKDPAQRYGSASELGEDIGRFLAGEPVKAHAHTAMYLLRKRAWKYRIPISALAVTMTIVVGAILFYVLSIQAERDKTFQQYQRAEQKTIEANDAAALAQANAEEADRNAEQAQENATQAQKNAAEADRNAVQAAENAEEAQRNAEQAQKALARAEELLWMASRTAGAEATRRQAENKPFEAIMYAGRALELRSENERAAEIALELISERTPALPRKILEDNRPVETMSVYPDGSRLAIGYFWRETKVWDVVTGECLFTLPGRLGPISSHKKWIFTYDSKTVYLWNSETGERLRQFPVAASELAWLALDPVAKRLAIGHAKDSLIRILDTQTGEEMEPFRGHTQGVRFVQFTTDGQHLVSYAEDGTIRIWNGLEPSREQMASIETERLRVNFGALRLNPKSHSLAAVSDGQLTFYHIPSGQKLNDMQTERLDYCTYGPRGDLFAIVDNRTIRIHNPQINQPVAECHGMPGAISQLAFSADGTRIAATGDEGTCMVWNARSGELISRMVHESAASHVTFCGTDAMLATAAGSDTRGVRIWAVNGRLDNVVVLKQDDTAGTLKLRSDGKRLAAISHFSSDIWDLESNQLIKQFPGRGGDVHFLPGDRLLYVGPIADRSERLVVRSLIDDEELFLTGEVANAPESVAVAPSGKSVVAGNDIGDLMAWDLNTGEVLFDAKVSEDARGLAHRKLLYSHDEEQFVSSSLSVVASLRMMDATDGRMTFVGRITAGEVDSYDFSPDGKKLLCGYQDAKIRIWDLEKNELSKTIGGHEHIVVNIRYHPDGHRFVSESMDGTCRLWDAESGEQIAIVRRKGTLGMFGFAYSKDGSLIATYGDEVIQLHDGENGKLILSLPGHTGEIQDVLFNADNEVISAAADNTVRIWKRPPKPGVAPDWVASDLIPAISNLVGADDGSIQPIAPGAWWQAWQALQALPTDDTDSRSLFEHWYRWHQADPRLRSVAPFSTQTIPQWVEEIAAANPSPVTPAVRDKLIRIAPSHPLTPLLMAGVQEESNPKNHAPENLAMTYRRLTIARLRDEESKHLYGEETLNRYSQHAVTMLKAQGQDDLAEHVQRMFP